MKIKSDISKTSINFNNVLKKASTTTSKITNYVTDQQVTFNSDNNSNNDLETITLCSSIFDSENDSTSSFGGNQGALVQNIENYLNDENIWEIVNKYYPDATEEDLELLFNRMNFVGCGYVAAINTIFQYFQSIPNGESKFEEIFGFSMLTYKQNSPGGETYLGYRYEYMFLDFFLYYAKNEKGFQTIEEVYGNVEEEMKIRDNDAALDDEIFIRTGMGGTSLIDAGRVLSGYLAEKGIQLSVNSNTITKKVILEPGTAEWEKRKKELEEVGINIPDNQPIIENKTEKEKVNIKEVLREGKFAIVSAHYFTLFSPEDLDGNGKLDDIVYDNVGDHAMTIVDVLDDGRYLVSSWGKEYILDPSIDDTGVIIYDYER